MVKVFSGYWLAISGLNWKFFCIGVASCFSGLALNFFLKYYKHSEYHMCDNDLVQFFKKLQDESNTVVRKHGSND